MWRRLGLSLVFCALLLGCSSGGSSGSIQFTPLPQWSSFRRDTSNSGVGLGAVQSNQGQMRALIDAEVSSPPAIGLDGRLYVGTTSGLLALETAENVQWRFESCDVDVGLPDADRCIGTDVVGEIRAAPALTAGGDIVVVSTAGCVFAVHDEGPTGRCLWATTLPGSGTCTGADTCARSSPQAVIRAGDLTLASVFLGGPGGTLQALNGNGSERWRFTGTGAALGPITSTVAIGGDGVFLTTAGGVLQAVDAAGRSQWRVTIGSDGDAGTLTPSPAVGLAVYAVGGAGRLFAYNPDGSLKWSFETATATRLSGSPAVASQLVEEPDGTTLFEPIVYVVDREGTLYGVRDSTGQVLELPRCTASNEACTVDSCQSASEGTCQDGHCTDTGSDCTADSCLADDGTCVLRSASLLLVPDGSPNCTSPTVSADLFAMVGTDAGSLCARQLDGTTPETPIWQTGCLSLGGGPVQYPPVTGDDDVIYVVADGTLYAIE